MTVRALTLQPEDLVLFRHHLEASEGIGFVIARKGGDILLVGPKSRADELDAFLRDMCLEFVILEHSNSREQPSSRHEEALRVAL